MTKILRRSLLALALAPGLAAFAYSLPASANDSVMGGSAASLVPLVDTPLRMLSEDILITAEDRYWNIVAKYRFQNPTAKQLSERVGFPEYGCEGGEEQMCDRDVLAFKEMQTWVDGKLVRHTKGKIATTHPWAPKLGTVWLYDVTFPAKSVVEVEHHYRVKQGYDSSGGTFGVYVTHTGAPWAGTIGHALFRIRMPITAWEVDQPSNSAAPKVVEIDGKSLLESRREYRNWEPDGDIFFSYNDSKNFSDCIWEEAKSPYPANADTSSIPGGEIGCPDIFRILIMSEGISPTNCQKASPEKIAEAMRTLAPKNSLRICKNAIFALRGKLFANEDLNRYFYGSDRGEKLPVSQFGPNRYFQKSFLTKNDWRAIALIDKYLAPEDTLENENASDTTSNPSSKTTDATPDLKTDAREQATTIENPTSTGGESTSTSATLETASNEATPAAAKPKGCLGCASQNSTSPWTTLLMLIGIVGVQRKIRGSRTARQRESIATP